MAVTPEAERDIIKHLEPKVVTLLREVRGAHRADPRPIVRAWFDSVGREHDLLFTQLGIEVDAPLGPSTFNQVFDLAARQL